MQKQRRNRIILDPKVMAGKPVIRGTRITVELVLGQLAGGITVEEILKNYPHLTREDVYAAIKYATERIAEERVYPLAKRTHVKTSSR